MDEVWVLIAPDGSRIFKGSGWRQRGQIKAYDNQRSAKAAAAQWSGVTVRRFVLAKET